MVGIKINSILLYEMKEQWYKKQICEFWLLNFIPIVLTGSRSWHSKNVNYILEAQLLMKSFFYHFLS